MNKSYGDLFLELVDYLVAAGANESAFFLQHKKVRGTTYLLLDQSDRAYGDCRMTVYAIVDTNQFMLKLSDKLSKEDPADIDLGEGETHNAVWELLERDKLVTFDEF